MARQASPFNQGSCPNLQAQKRIDGTTLITAAPGPPGA